MDRELIALRDLADNIAGLDQRTLYSMNTQELRDLIAEYRSLASECRELR